MSFLVVDDNDVFREQLVRSLQRRGKSAMGAACTAQAFSCLAQNEIQNVILDLKIPGVQGLDLLHELLRRYSDLNIVVLTGYGSIPLAVEATRAGAKNFLLKPLNLDDILQAFTGESAPLPGEVQTPSLESVEWEHIQRVLTECQGNISATASRLGLHRRSLQRKLARGNP